MELRELYAQSIEELTQEDYDEDQRAAWVSVAADAQAFGERLASGTTLVVEIDGEYAGFGSLKDNRVVDMLFVHPYFAGGGLERRWSMPWKNWLKGGAAKRSMSKPATRLRSSSRNAVMLPKRATRFHLKTSG